METKKAKELGLVPANWSNNMMAKADFASYYELLCNLVKLCDESAMTKLETLINNKNYPDRDINRDDALMMLFLTAEALGYNKQNARGYGFCTENEINFDLANSQISWDYPYCDLMREVSLLTDYGPEPIGTLPTTAQFWLQRHMDINQRLHFFDCDDNLDFHLDEVLTREAAIASVVRLYNAETLNYDAYVGMCQMTETEKNQAKDSVKVQTLTTAKDNELKNSLQSAIDDILNSKTEIVHSDTYIKGETYTGTAYYVSEDGDDGNDGLSPETAWRTLQHVMVLVGDTDQESTIKAGDAVFLRRGDTFRLPDSAFIIESDGITFSAYGEGAKPIITSSSESGVGAEKWELAYEDATGKKIWKFYHDMRDVGMIVLNNGEIFAKRVYEYYGDNGYISCHYERGSMEGNLSASGVILEERLFSLEETLMKNLTIVSRPEVVDGSTQKGPLYLRCDEGNPGEIFSSVEFTEAELLGIVWLQADNTVFDNISFRCYGTADVKNGKLDVRELDGTVAQNCEFAFGGGSVINYFLNEIGEPCIGVMSDGFFGPVKNTILRNNYMHDSMGCSITYETGSNDIGREPASGYFHILDNVLYGTENGPDCNALLKLFAFDYEAKFMDYTRPLIQNNVFVQYKGRRFADFEWQDEDAWYLEDEDFAEKMYYFFGETESEFYIIE